LDASGGLEIGEGCQIGAWVGIFTHGSNNSIRFLGHRFVDIIKDKRIGYVKKPVRIGEYTFISSGVIILPGVTIGRGCVIGPNCVIMADVPDYSILISTPARVVGTTLVTDSAAMDDLDFQETYYDKELLDQLRALARERKKS